MSTSWVYTVNILTGRDAIQDHLDKLERWVHVNFMEVNWGQGPAYVLGQFLIMVQTGGEWIENSSTEKDLRILVNENWIWAGNVHLQPRKPTVSWAKRAWPVCWMEGCHCETPPDKLNPVVGLLVQERHEPAGMASVKGCEDCQRSRTLLWRKAETVGRV